MHKFQAEPRPAVAGTGAHRTEAPSPGALCYGPVRIAPPVLLAPMSGVTDPPFRRLARRLGAPAVVSEMIASNEAVRQSRVTQARLVAESGERPRIIQLAGHDPAAIAEATRLCVDLGADAVDLNFGCPAKKVTNKLCGSALMREPETAEAIMAAAVEAATPHGVPVTAKMRTGWDAEERNAPDFARRAERVGIAAVTVHGRTRAQKYDGSADWAFIGEVADAVSVPLIANGDIVDADSLSACLATTGAAAAMIGRGACGRPWLPGQAARYLETGIWPPDPAPPEIAEIVAEHYDGMLSHYGTHSGVRAARKHLAWYLKAFPGGLKGAAQLRERLMRLEEPAAVLRLVRDAFAAGEPVRDAA